MDNAKAKHQYTVCTRVLYGLGNNIYESTDYSVVFNVAFIINPRCFASKTISNFWIFHYGKDRRPIVVGQLDFLLRNLSASHYIPYAYSNTILQLTDTLMSLYIPCFFVLL